MNNQKKLLGLTVLVLACLAIWLVSKNQDHRAEEHTVTKSELVRSPSAELRKVPRVSEPVLDLMNDFIKDKETEFDHTGTVHWPREPRPFAVIKESEFFQWTAEDAMTPAAMVQLASNGDNLEFFEEENQWANRRQLVYVKEEFSQAVQEVYNGEVTELTLPGFDGAEFKIKIEESEVSAIPEAGPLSGIMYGEVEGLPGSRVYLSSYEDYWSIAIEHENSQIQILNREHGEWILSDINAAKFAHHNGGAECGLQRPPNDTGELITQP